MLQRVLQETATKCKHGRALKYSIYKGEPSHTGEYTSAVLNICHRSNCYMKSWVTGLPVCSVCLPLLPLQIIPAK